MTEKYIYALYDTNDIPVYIGQAADPKVREQAHRVSRVPFARMEILQVVPKAKARDAERAAIADFKARGYKLLNKQHYRPRRISIAMRVKRTIAAFIQEEALRAGVTPSQMTETLLDEAITARKKPKPPSKTK